MQRRQFHHLSLGGMGFLIVAAQQRAWALSLSDLTNQDAAAGIRTALEQGARAAVALLGKPDGFLGNPKVRIPLPGYLEDAARLLKFAGQGARVDELVTGMNRAAEQAVPLGQELLVNAVKTMSVSDAKNILGGGDNSVTQFFAERTREPLGEKFLPVVQQTTAKLGLARSYNRVAEKAMGFGLVKKEDASIERYVTGKSLDGLYTIIGDEERKIRQDPVGTGSAILKKVFGSLK